MLNPAEVASEKALKELFAAIDNRQCFRLEAGAGAGKTYSLIQALKRLIGKEAGILSKTNKRIACITYTNVAKNEICDRTDNHPVVFAETIHAFSWSLIQDFQQQMREYIPTISDKWNKRIEDAGGINKQYVKYDLGYPSASPELITLHHDDVIKIMSHLLGIEKFQQILKSRHPIIFIDEYQDTNKELAQAIVEHLIGGGSGILIGFFGDHWQKIYGSNACGLITNDDGNILEIGKNANFRSQRNIVDVLNRMRPELPQYVPDPKSEGDIFIFHSNAWSGGRRPGGPGGHWKDDLPAEDAKSYRDRVMTFLEKKGWEFTYEKTKVLMLTNSVLAEEQGYLELTSAFNDTDDYLKPNDHYIKYFRDIIEPTCECFSKGRFGEMFQIIGTGTPKLKSQKDKETWNNDIKQLIKLRETSSIGDVIEHLKITKHPRLSAKIEEAEARYNRFSSLGETEKEKEDRFHTRVTIIKKTKYKEMIELNRYINDQTPFSTKHGVKGAQFENVLVICGRGWNHYDWNQMLDWAQNGPPKGKESTFERNRNLFYVVCSRPKKRLAVLFTQYLSNNALRTVSNWFEEKNIIGEPNV